MERRETLVLDERDLDLVQTLVQLGLKRNQAKALIFLAQVDEAVSQQIEQGADMRQPEVSVAMRELRRLGWVEKRNVEREGKGRPLHAYRLSGSLEAILDEIERDKRRTIERDLQRIERIRETLPLGDAGRTEAF